MNNKEMIDKYGIIKKTGILILLQMMIMMGALVISLFGIFKSLDLVSNINRLIVYGGQAFICFATILFGIYYFNKTTELTSDMPGEAKLYPERWGKMKFTK